MSKRLASLFLSTITCVIAIGFFSVSAYSAENIILDGIYADNVSLGGLTEKQAKDSINQLVDELSHKTITLYTANDQEVTITPAEIGFAWVNQDIVSEAAKLGHSGSVVSRYKAKKDLLNSNKVYDIKFNVDEELISQILEERCAVYDSQESSGLLTRVDGHFVINEGETGAKLNIADSTKELASFLTETWTGDNTAFQLKIDINDPEGTYEQLALVKDVLGTFHTNFKSSGPSRSANVKNGARLINGSVIYPGEEFSFYNHIKPFTAANGYEMAAAYASGKVVDSIGGGICQVSSTLYNSVLYAELEVTNRRNHAMIVSYVDPARDATIAESSGIDFLFRNNTDAPIYIEAFTTEGKELYITIYGHETRPADRKVEYVSEVVEKKVPDTENIYTDSSAPVGTIDVQSAHIGYKANLWKKVTQNGETTKELVNTSSYAATPKYATVGMATDNPQIASIMQEAVASGSIDTVRAAIATCKSIQSGEATTNPLEQYEAALKAQEATQEAQSQEPAAEETKEEPAAEEAPAEEQSEEAPAEE